MRRKTSLRCSVQTPSIQTVMDELDGWIREVRTLRGEANWRLLEHSLSMAHLHLLWTLDCQPEMTMSQAAGVLGVSMSNATGVIDRMEEQGVVERARIPDDRRVVLVRLTEQGRAILREMELMRHGHMLELLGRLDEEQLARVAQALRDLRRAAEAVRRERNATGSDTRTTPAARSTSASN